MGWILIVEIAEAKDMKCKCWEILSNWHSERYHFAFPWTVYYYGAFSPTAVPTLGIVILLNFANLMSEKWACSLSISQCKRSPSPHPAPYPWFPTGGSAPGPSSVWSLGLDLARLGTLNSEAEKQSLYGLLHQILITNLEKVSKMTPLETFSLWNLRNLQSPWALYWSENTLFDPQI